MLHDRQGRRRAELARWVLVAGWLARGIAVTTPTLQSARFDISGTFFNVTFNQSTTQGAVPPSLVSSQTGTFDCAGVLNASTVTLIGTLSDTSCTWNSDTVLRVTLPSSSAVAVGDTITLATDAVYSHDGTLWSSAASGSVQIAAPSPLSAPVIIVDVVTSNCGRISIDATHTLDTGGQPTYWWGPTSGLPDGLQTLFAASTTANSGSLVLYESDRGTSVSSLSVRVNVTSRWGNTSTLLISLPLVVPCPTETPTKSPTSTPSAQPTTATPTVTPTTGTPSEEPTPSPTRLPTKSPTLPTEAPTPRPTTSDPTGAPSLAPTVRPTFPAPTPWPTVEPTSTSFPTDYPTRKPTTQGPTSTPTTPLPTYDPTRSPTHIPSSEPTSVPTAPTNTPSVEPTTANPSRSPTRPTPAPTQSPTGADCLSTSWRSLYNCGSNLVINPRAGNISGRDEQTCCVPACSGYTCPDSTVRMREAVSMPGNDAKTCCNPIPSAEPTPPPSLSPTSPEVTDAPTNPPQTAIPTLAPTKGLCQYFYCPRFYYLKPTAFFVRGSTADECCDPGCEIFPCPDTMLLRTDSRMIVGNTSDVCCYNKTMVPTEYPTAKPTAAPQYPPSMPPTLTPTYALYMPTVSFSVSLDNINYALLEQNSSLLGAFHQSIVDRLASQVGVPPTNVDVLLSAGSVLTQVVIHLPIGASLRTVSSRLGAPEQIPALLIAGVLTVQGVGAVVTGPLNATLISAPSMVGMDIVGRGMCRSSALCNAQITCAEGGPWPEDNSCSDFQTCMARCHDNALCRGMAQSDFPSTSGGGCKSAGKPHCVLYLSTAGGSLPFVDMVTPQLYKDYACYAPPFAASAPTGQPTKAPTNVPTAPVLPAAVESGDALTEASKGLDPWVILLILFVVFAIAVAVGACVGYYCVRSRTGKNSKVFPGGAIVNDAAALLMPRYWENRSPYGEFHYLVTPHYTLQTCLAAMLYEGGIDDAEIVRVQRNENSGLWSKYAQYRNQVKINRRNVCKPVDIVTQGGALLCNIETYDEEGPPAELDWSCNEVYLLHGTTPEKLTSSSRSLSLLRTPDEDNLHKYGPGFYFSDVSSGSHALAGIDRLGGLKGHRCLLLCRVTLGEVFRIPDDKVKREQKRREAAAHRIEKILRKKSHDSIAGYHSGFREFVVFNEDAIYPEYVIVYKVPDDQIEEPVRNPIFAALPAS